jgi:sugar lactone lactonase YvrE
VSFRAAAAKNPRCLFARNERDEYTPNQSKIAKEGDTSIASIGGKHSAGLEKDQIGYSRLLAHACLRALVFVLILLGLLCGPSRLIGDAHAEVTDASPAAAASASATPMPKLSPAIYTTLPSLDTVAVYPLASNGNVPSLAGNASISNPSGIGYWAGRLYVTNQPANSITVYPAGASGSTSPIVTIQGEHTLLDSPTAIAFDSSGNIYVANAGKQGGGHDTITKYPAGSTGDAAPVAEIKGANTKLFSPSGLTVDSSGNIYVANPGLISGTNQKLIVQAVDTITVYSPGSTGNIAPIRTISGNLTRLSLSGIAVDSSGYIYANSLGVEGSRGAGILIFAPGSNGNVAPIKSIGSDCGFLTTTGPIALDANANIYVGDYDKIVFFVHNDLFADKREVLCMPPAFQISGSQTGIKEITGISVDSVGDIFVTDSESDSVSAFQSGDNGDIEPSATIATANQIFEPTGVALDSSGRIYVANGNRDRTVSDTVTIYAPGSNASTPPVASIGRNDFGVDDKAEISSPLAVAVDKEGKVYVANQGGGIDGSVTVYSAGSVGNVAPIAKIAGTKTGDKTGLKSPIGLAVDASNKLYVLNEFGEASHGSITIYSSGASGNVAPEATISDGAGGKHTQLNSPAGLALDSAGNIYVTNDGGSNSITVYAAGSKGDVAPKAVISGSDTRLSTPRGIAIDSNGNIYVANASDGVVLDGVEEDNGSETGPATITVYPPGSNGNVKPIATITGPLTSLAHPNGIAIGPASLTPPPPQALAFYDWSVTASPNLAADAPSREVVERAMASIKISTTTLEIIGGTYKLRSYKFADLRHNGFLSMLAQTGPDWTPSCSDSHSGGFCSVYIIDKTGMGFEIYQTFGSIEPGGTVPLGIQDLKHDGNLQVIVSQPFTSILNRQPSPPPLRVQCIASWPAIYASSGGGYPNVSDHFKDFYRDQLDALNKLIPNLPPTGASYDQRDKECLDAEVAKLERVLGSPNAGIDTAIASTQSKDLLKATFGIYILMDINTPEANQYLASLSNSPNPDIKRMLTQMTSLRSKGFLKDVSQFERLR